MKRTRSEREQEKRLDDLIAWLDRYDHGSRSVSADTCPDDLPSALAADQGRG